MKLFKAIGEFFNRICGTKRCHSLAELQAYIKPGEVMALGHWIQQRIAYRPDATEKDEWKPADVTIKDGQGDCEDMAIVAKDVIKSWPDWRAFIVCGYPASGPGHAVCLAIRPDGCVVTLSNGGVSVYYKLPLEQAYREMFPAGWRIISYEETQV